MARDKNIEIARSVYDTPRGRALLADLLNDLRFFSVIEDEVDMISHNQALALLNKLGIWQEHNITRIVNALMDMPYKKEGK